VFGHGALVQGWLMIADRQFTTREKKAGGKMRGRGELFRKKLNSYVDPASKRLGHFMVTSVCPVILESFTWRVGLIAPHCNSATTQDIASRQLQPSGMACTMAANVSLLIGIATALNSR
jgi:hypothetical protein